MKVVDRLPLPRNDKAYLLGSIICGIVEPIGAAAFIFTCIAGGVILDSSLTGSGEFGGPLLKSSLDVSPRDECGGEVDVDCWIAWSVRRGLLTDAKLSRDMTPVWILFSICGGAEWSLRADRTGV